MPFNCKHCNAEVDHQYKYTCRVCGKEVNDKFKCRFCGKTFTTTKAFFHGVKELPKAAKRFIKIKIKKESEDSMGKLIVNKEGKLVKEEDVVVAAVEQPKNIVPPKQDLNDDAKEAEDFRQFMLQKKAKEDMMKQAQLDAEIERQQQQKMYEEALAYKQQQYVEQQQYQAAAQRAQQPVEQPIIYHIILNNGMDLDFKINPGELDSFVSYIHDSIATKPLLHIDKQTIPVKAISLMYYE